MGNIEKIYVSGMEAYVDYIIHNKNKVIAASIFGATAGKLNAISAIMSANGTNPVVELQGGRLRMQCQYEKYKAFSSKVSEAHSYFVNNLVVAEGPFIVTTAESKYEDMYHFMMNEYDIPLLQDWMPYILAESESRGYIAVSYGAECVFSSNMDRGIVISDRRYLLRDIAVIDIEKISEEGLKSIISDGLKRGSIRITDHEVEKLQVEGLDDYMLQYADSIMGNVSGSFQPLTQYRGKVEGLALKNKKLFPQQAMVVNSMKGLHASGSKYGLIVAEMGTGKTIMAESFCESLHVEKAMRKNGLSELEVYKNPALVNYRVVIMAPGHLVNTWKNDIEKEIPYAKVEIINDLKQLIAIRERGKERRGREFFILGKDFAKLSSTIAPIPTKVKESDVFVQVCSDCAEDGTYIVRKYGEKRCGHCGGKNFRKYRVGLAGKQEGMVCPTCSELLLGGGKTLTINMEPEEAMGIVLTPGDFRAHRDGNDICYHCNSKLWGVDAKTLNADNEFHDMVARKRPKWYKVRAYKNTAMKVKKSEGSVRTFFALKGHEDEAYLDLRLALGESLDRKSRKIAPAQYIKKYLKGFFDVCILDEVHKFEGAGTAQSVAAHAISSAAKFTLGLTGTLTNGTAASLFYLLYMLDPVRMNSKGYKYSDVMEFVRKYGTVETEYAYNGGDGEEYKKSARGRVLKQPKVRPGISPLIYAEYLLDKAVFLNIADFSNFLPKFTEKPVIVAENADVMGAYKKTMSEIMKNLRTKAGHAAAMAGLLQCGMSYTDKPYGRKPIMSTVYEDYVVAEYGDLEQYRSVSNLLEKEKKLVELVNQEISEDRNVFVFASYTGQAESNVTYRLQEVLEEHCNLKGAVQVMESASPSASRRADWIHKKASEGIRVFICNPSLVETGLDFKFEYDGKTYNYPTIMFYQIDYKLATFWQASRRAFRLNQTEECRNYYFATMGTAQAVALKVITDKKLAASALQGNFSAEGLEAMSSGQDEKTLLVKKLMEGASDTGEDLASMFDVLNDNTNSSAVDNTVLEEYRSVKNFYELTGLADEAGAVADSLLADISEELLNTVKVGIIYNEPKKQVEKAEEATPVNTQDTQELPNVDLGAMMGMNGFGFGNFGSFATACTESTEKAESKDVFGNFGSFGGFGNFGASMFGSTESTNSAVDTESVKAGEETKKPKTNSNRKKKKTSAIAAFVKEAQMAFEF